jgi:hypothetical protein
VCASLRSPFLVWCISSPERGAIGDGAGGALVSTGQAVLPTTLLPVAPLSSTSFPHFAFPVASTVLPRSGLLVTGCSDGVVLVWDLVPPCHRLSHPAGAVLCPLRGSFDGKHVLAPPSTWTVHPQAAGPRVLAVTTVDSLGGGAPGTAIAPAPATAPAPAAAPAPTTSAVAASHLLTLGSCDDVAASILAAERWVQGRALAQGGVEKQGWGRPALASLACLPVTNGTPCSTPVVLSLEGVTAARAAMQDLGPHASCAYLYLLSDLTLVVLPGPELGLHVFDPRLVSLCDPALLEGLAAVRCVGSPSAPNDALEASPSPLFPAVSTLFARRASVLRVVFVACGSSVPVGDLLAPVISSTITHPEADSHSGRSSVTGPVSVGAAPLSHLQRLLLEQHAAVLARGSGWRATMRTGGDPWASSAGPHQSSWTTGAPLHTIGFYAPGDDAQRWAPVGAGTAGRTSVPPALSTLVWVPGIVVAVSWDTSVAVATVALCHAEDSVTVPLARVRPADPALQGRTIAPDDAVTVCMEAPWLAHATQFVESALGVKVPAPVCGASDSTAPQGGEGAGASRPRGAADVDVLCVTVVEGASQGPSIKLLCTAVGAATVSVPVVRHTAPLPPQVRPSHHVAAMQGTRRR